MVVPQAGSLVEDLVAEHAVLDGLVGGLGDAEWDLATPAEGWAVRDQVSHLAFFDDVATTAMTAPERFATDAARLLGSGDPMHEHLERGRSVPAAAVLEWWRSSRAAMVDAAGRLDPDQRVPWFGPSMSPRSFLSARLMETWAHGQDVADALGVGVAPTSRLRHIAHLGVRARPFSYAVRGFDVPAGDIRVELDGPEGDRWVWGDAGASQSVRGPALDFCLVVTQRRHPDATALVAFGADAARWLSIAQAFAGPPGPGRPAPESA